MIEEREAKDRESPVRPFQPVASVSSLEKISSFKGPTMAKSKKTTSKRPRPSSEEEKDDLHHDPGKKARTDDILDFHNFMRMILNNDDNNNKKVDHDRDDEIEACRVKPDDIPTTFADIHIGLDALEALDTLMLSFYDPSAFTFGILASSSPQGILFYGAPGTGKTLLVRALAKQANATILALSGADIRSKYVGDGERKIQRIFAYARKYHPCVIFIDEADAVFHSRSAENNCRGHLDEINQFLVEMDGIKSNGIRSPMVIAATNRPFDIDEGVLRRLGRRIMVDVPNAVARDHILKIQLKGEIVADDVDISGLVQATQDYTGSDLRNLVHAAATLAVRENLYHRWQGLNLQGGASIVPMGSDSPRRVLRKAHFLRAKQEIRASPKSDTVAKIREFHNKFGNTAQRVALDDQRPDMINKTKVTVSA